MCASGSFAILAQSRAVVAGAGAAGAIVAAIAGAVVAGAADGVGVLAPVAARGVEGVEPDRLPLLTAVTMTVAVATTVLMITQIQAPRPNPGFLVDGGGVRCEGIGYREGRPV